MISLKSLMKSVKEAKITSAQKGVETPLDAKIQISGYGVMTRKQLQKSIVRTLHEVSQYVKKGNFSNAYSSLYKRGVLKAFLETELKHNGE
tara:strand:- start:14 stop:286 length:273 start_codon:yes stop_codon:yes gene_type:complete